MAIEIIVAGAAGRTGGRIVALGLDDADINIVAALEASGSPAIGRNVCGSTSPDKCIEITSDASRSFDVWVDFSLPAGTMQGVRLCRELGKPIVIGTTGHSEAELAEIEAAAADIPVLKAPNMSVGINVMFRLARQLGEVLDPSYDVEISETHHRFKVDAPSGTAIGLLEAVRASRAQVGNPSDDVVFGRQGETGQRPAGQIGVHSLRVGDTVGEHTVSFGTLGETISIRHEAHSRDTFAVGALRAAKWIANRPAGRYDMQDVLFGTG